MSENTNPPRPFPAHSNTLIGMGMRVEGHVSFIGDLHIQGEIVGDVSCPDTSKGKLVVGTSGCITGTVSAPRIVVKGRIDGPMHSSESIELLEGAQCTGGANYKSLAVDPGSSIIGVLTHGDPAVQEGTTLPSVKVSVAPRQGIESQEMIAVASAAVPDLLMPQAPPTASRTPASALPKHAYWSGPKIAALAALVLTAGGLIWISQGSPVRPADSSNLDVASEARTSVPMPDTPIAPPAAAEKESLPEPKPAPTPTQAAPRPEANTEPPAAAPLRPEPEMNKIIAVEGVNPDKSATNFFLATREPVVLFRKKKDGNSEGKRIDVARGRNVGLPIGQNEVFRIAQGRNFDLFFQGRKLSPHLIESGTWLSFVPVAAPAPSKALPVQASEAGSPHPAAN